MATEHLDDNGNVRVDFAWGNMPMQPNYGRTDSYYEFGGGYMMGDNGWDSAYQNSSDTLDTMNTVWLANGLLTSVVNNNHSMVYEGYSNFPEFIPNYAGDEDSDLETVIPNIVGLSRYQAEDALDAAHLSYDSEWYYTLAIWALETNGTTGKVWVDEWPQITEGLKAGDVLWFDWNDGSDNYSKLVTLTSKGYDQGQDSATLEFTINDPIAEYTYSNELYGSMYAGSEDTYGRVLTVDRPPVEGDIVDEGTGVYFYILGDD